MELFKNPDTRAYTHVLPAHINDGEACLLLAVNIYGGFGWAFCEILGSCRLADGSCIFVPLFTLYPSFASKLTDTFIHITNPPFFSSRIHGLQPSVHFTNLSLLVPIAVSVTGFSHPTHTYTLAIARYRSLITHTLIVERASFLLCLVNCSSSVPRRPSPALPRIILAPPSLPLIHFNSFVHGCHSPIDARVTCSAIPLLI